MENELQPTEQTPRKRRWRWWHVLLTVVGGLLVLLLLVVGIAMWIIFTPKQLTSVVNRVLPNIVQCDAHVDRVGLNLLRTFPDAGIDIVDVTLDNPTNGAPSDTLAHLGRLTVGLDVKKYLKEKEVVVHQVLLNNVSANLFIDSLGHSNFDIFPHSDKEKDTTSSTFSLDSLPTMDLRRVSVNNLCACYLDQQKGIDAVVDDFDLGIHGSLNSGLVDATVDVDIDKLAATLTDSLGHTKLAATLNNTEVKVAAKGNLDQVQGKLSLNVKDGLLNSAETEMINQTLAASKHDLLQATIPFNADLKQMHIDLDQSQIKLDQFGLNLQGSADLQPMALDVQLGTDGAWQVAPLLDIVPAQFVSFRKGMDMDAKVSLQATAVGPLHDSLMPRVTAQVQMMDGRFYYPQALPYRIRNINANVDADVDLNQGGNSSVVINNLKAQTLGTQVAVNGRVDDLMGDMHVDAHVRGNLPLEDAKPLLPDTLPFSADGTADLDLRANLKMSQLKAKAFDRMKASGTVKLRNLNVQYDSIHAQTPDLDIALQLPATQQKGKMAEAHLQGSQLEVDMPALVASVRKPDIFVAVNDITREQIAAAFAFSMEQTKAVMDSNSLDLSALNISGTVRMDSTQSNILRKLNPSLDVDMRQTRVETNLIAEQLYINNLDFHYSPELCEIADADIKLGNSDLQLYGDVRNLEPWLSHEAMLTGELNLRSNFTDVDQLMDLFSGMGSDKDTIEQMRQEDSVPKEANPFIVPMDVDFTLHTHLKQSLAFGNELGDVAGSVTVKDGVAVLDQIGFVCKAATMQLTALYRSPRPNHLFAALDFHLLDIQIDELLDMIPTVDTLVPMLAAFNGNANFHLAGETYLDAFYKPKMSTLLGSAAISGKDLVLIDNNSIAQIAKLMQFKNWKEKDDKIHIDSLDVEMTCFRKEIEVFPFLINIGNYSLCASGKHRLTGECGYHVELLKNPLLAKVGVDVGGTLKSPKISLGEVRYADLYKPQKQGVVEKETLAMKKMIREALEANVR